MPNDDLRDTIPVPKVRDLTKLVEALDIAEDELSFQVHRLSTMVTPRTDEEREHLDRLKEGYAKARPFLRTLKKYHQGRLDRLNAGDSLAKEDLGTEVGPYLDE